MPHDLITLILSGLLSFLFHYCLVHSYSLSSLLFYWLFVVSFVRS